MLKNQLVALALIPTLFVGCAGKAAQIAVTIDTSSLQAISKVKEAKDVRCDAGQLPESACVALAKAFVPVWDAYLALNTAILNGTPLDKLGALKADLQAAGEGFVKVVNEVGGDYKTILLDLLATALKGLI